jgi:hypothetical protein
MVQPGRPRWTIRRMRIACRIPKATNTHSTYVIVIALQRQQLLNERACVNVIPIFPVFFFIEQLAPPEDGHYNVRNM